MRIFALSDIHVDFKQNRKWVEDLSLEEYKEDILILAGDISSRVNLINETFSAFKKRFSEVFFIPGNHDLWVKESPQMNSLDKLKQIHQQAEDYGVRMEPAVFGSLRIIPLYGWYDFSFGTLPPFLAKRRVDFTACRWPEGFEEQKITRHFLDMNKPFLETGGENVLTFSHFLPDVDLMPGFIPKSRRVIYPVLGSSLIGEQVSYLKPVVHIYGHSHVNQNMIKDGIHYINNAFGYPYETRIAAKRLVQVDLSEKDIHVYRNT